MIGKILRGHTTLKDINEATSAEIVIWTQRVEVQRAKREVMDQQYKGRQWIWLSDRTSANMTVLGRIGIEGLIIVNIVVQGAPRDSVWCMARCVAVAARPNTSRQCHINAEAMVRPEVTEEQQVSAWGAYSTRSPVH